MTLPKETRASMALRPAGGSENLNQASPKRRRPSGRSEDGDSVASKRRHLNTRSAAQLSPIDVSTTHYRGQGAPSINQASPSTTKSQSSYSENFDWDVWRTYIVYLAFTLGKTYAEVAQELTEECANAEDADPLVVIVILERQVKGKLEKWDYGKHFHESDLPFLVRALDDVRDAHEQEPVVRYRGELKKHFQIRRHINEVTRSIAKPTTKRRKYEGWTVEMIRNRDNPQYPGEYPAVYPKWFDFQDLSNQGKPTPSKPNRTRRLPSPVRGTSRHGLPSHLSTPDIPSRVLETGSQFPHTPCPQQPQDYSASESDVILDGSPDVSPFQLPPRTAPTSALQVPGSGGQYDEAMSQYYTSAPSSHLPTASSMTSADVQNGIFITSYSFKVFISRMFDIGFRSEGRGLEYELFQLLSGSKVERIENLDADALEQLSAELTPDVDDESASSPERFLQYCLTGLAFRGRNNTAEVEQLAKVSFEAAHTALFSMMEARNPKCLILLHIVNILACCFGRGHAMGDLLGLRLTARNTHNPGAEPVSAMLDLMVCFLKEEENDLEDSLSKLEKIQVQLREQFPHYPLAAMIAQLNYGWRAASRDVVDEEIRLKGHQALLDLKGPLEKELGHLEFTPIIFLVLLAKSASRLAPSSQHPFPLQEAFGFLNIAVRNLEAAKYPRYHPCYLEVMFRLGDYLLQDNRPNEALKILNSVLVQRQKLFGEDNGETRLADAMRKMALEALDLGQSAAEKDDCG